MLDVVHGFLVVVATEDEIDAHLGERAENSLRVFQSMTARQLTHHRIVMHDNGTRIAGARALEFRSRPLELIAPQIADDRDVAKIPGEGASRDTLRCVQSNDRRAGDPEHRLDVLADIAAIVLEHCHRVAKSERCLPPGNVVIAGHDDHFAESLGVLEEHASALEFTRARAL